MTKVYSPGVYPVEYIGEKEILFRAAVRSKKFNIQKGDIVLVDHVTAVLLNRKAEYRKIDEEDYSIKITITTKAKTKAAEEKAKTKAEEAKAKNPQTSRTLRK